MADERPFFSPYTLPSDYWIILQGADALTLAPLGLTPLPGHGDLLYLAAGNPWVSHWEKITALLPEDRRHLYAAVIAADTTPGLPDIQLALRPVAELEALARNLWLAQAVQDGRLICFMQRVVDRRSKNTGYEALARMEAQDGEIIGGGAIMQASHALHVEYQVDRLMHRQAIQCFVESDLEGVLFINFLTGFIHRPEVYLEGLSQAIDRYGLLPRSVALDVPLMDYSRDMAKLKSIAQYCHTRGIALSLDDVMGPEGLAGLLQEIRPAFVKLDGRLGGAMLDPNRQAPVLEIIRIAHAAGATVLAEGIENDALHQAYLAADVDLFQGYALGTPERCPPLTKQKRAS